MKSDEQLLASVLDFLPLGVWIARAPGGELVLANQTFREIMGMDAREDVARGEYAQPYGICQRDGSPYPEDKMPFVRALQERTTVMVDDIVIQRPDGQRANIRAFARPIFGRREDAAGGGDDDETITHVVIAFTDITAEEQLRETRRLEALGTLAAGVAHDFNNAMASVRVLATMLRMREKDPGRVEDLRRIEDATDRAAQLTRSLLTFGRHGGSRIGRMSLDIAAAAVVDLVRRTFDRNIEVRFVPRGDGAWIVGDAGQIEQLLMNLLVNARDAMPDGGRIEVRIRGGEKVVLEVTDTGPGIPRALRGRVFEPYFTTKQRDASPGTGLGLSTVFGIVQQHQGTIEIGDVKPHGARFTIEIPAAGEHGLALGSSRSVLRRGSGRILVVDDDEHVRTATRHLLEVLGYSVVEAADGIAAIEVFRNDDRIDAVLLDVIMARRGGRDTLPALRAIREVPVLVTSGIATEDELADWRDLGAAGLLAKPYNLGELSSALADAMRA